MAFLASENIAAEILPSHEIAAGVGNTEEAITFIGGRREAAEVKAELAGFFGVVRVTQTDEGWASRGRYFIL